MDKAHGKINPKVVVLGFNPNLTEFDDDRACKMHFIYCDMKMLGSSIPLPSLC